MAWYLVDNGVVIQKQPDYADGFISGPDEVVCGWLWDGVNFTAPPIPTPTLETIVLTKRQLRLGLVANGLGVNFVQSTIDGLPDSQQKQIAQIEWDEAYAIHWDHAVTQMLLAATGLETEQLESMWRDAAAL